MLSFFLSGWKRAFAPGLASTRPVIVMSRGHSGTRVLSRLCTCLGINMGANDHSPAGDVSDIRLQKEIKRIAARSLGVTRAEQVDATLLRRFRRAVSGYYGSLLKPANLWGWKFPETYLIGPYVAATFPNARYVHLIRDGRDIAFKQHLTDDPSRTLGRAILKRQGALRQPHHLQAALSWAYQVDHFDAFRASVPAAQVLDVSFGALCRRPAETAGELCAFLDVPMNDASRRFVGEGIDASRIDEHRHADAQLVREVETRIGPTLERYKFA